MSIQTEINRIKQSKENIISALETKGVTVPSDASIDDLSALVDAIEVATDPVLQSKTVTPSTSSQTVKPDTGYDGLSQVTVNAMPTATQATPSISVSSSGLITASATQTAGYVSAGTKSATKQLTTKGATTWTPKTTNQTIASGTYLTGTQTIKGDSNLKASNIKSGVSIFGVAGSLVEGITPSGTLNITENGTYDVTNYASANVNVASSGATVETCSGLIIADSPMASVNLLYIDKNLNLITTYAGDIGVMDNFLKNSIIVTSGLTYAKFSLSGGITKLYNSSTLCVWKATGDFTLSFDE